MTGFYDPNTTVAPPQNLDAEQSVLGAVLLSDTALTVIEEEGLQPDHFYREPHGVIYKGMLDLQASGAPVDAVTLCDWLKREGTLDKIGGVAAVELLAGSVPAVGNLRQYVKIVKRKAVDRWRLHAAYDQIGAVQAEDDDGWSKAIAAAENAATVGRRDTRIDPKENFWKWYESPPGWSTPYKQLTDALGAGLVPGDITVIGAWPGFGKTILCDSLVLCANEAQKARCHIYLNELNPGIRTARMLARMTSIDWQRIRAKDLTADEKDGCNKAFERFPTEYERSSGWRVEEYVRHLRRKRWDIAVIDSASRIPTRDTHELEQIVGALADVADEAQTHIILVVQLNLERCKQLERPAPMGRDLLGGGSWYRDARNVLFVHRNQEVATVHGQEKAIPLAEGLIYADKATHGEPEKSYVPVRFNSKRMTFEQTGTEPVPINKQTAYFDEFDDPAPQKRVASGGIDDTWDF